MTSPLAIHLAIMQPTGYVHSLGFLDQARYFRHQFRRLGATVTLAKNRLREDAVNVVFGAHLGFSTDWLERHACVFVNLEQLGPGGANVSAEYLDLLRRYPVVDYDAANVPAYAAEPSAVPIVPFGYAAYLDKPAQALEERPIDLLFFGSVNARRQQFIARVESAGFNVAVFDHPIYGAERDHFITQSKAVLNCHFYESNRFEQARAFHCLSLGTPVISERTPSTDPSPAFEDAVLWLPEQVEAWFAQHFARPAFYTEARRALEAFRAPDAAHDPLPAYQRMLAFAQAAGQAHARHRERSPWRPRAIHLGDAQDYRAAWLNIAADARAQPDLRLDFSAALALPFKATTEFGSPVLLEAGSVELIQAHGALERAADVRGLLDNALALLAEGGSLAIEVAHEKSPAAWRDPAHRRAFNEDSWHACTDGFAGLGWFEHRFEMTQAQWLDAARQPVAPEQASFMRVVLRKIPTTPRERTLARMAQADFGGLDDDLAPPAPRAAAKRPARVAPISSAVRADAPPRPVTVPVPSVPAAMPAARTLPSPSNPYGLPASLRALLLDA